MKAYFAQFYEFKDDKIIHQRNYDCFEPFWNFVLIYDIIFYQSFWLFNRQSTNQILFFNIYDSFLYNIINNIDTNEQIITKY